VAEELTSLSNYGFDLSFLEDNIHYIIREALNRKFIKSLSEHLDAGEAEAIALAKELKADLLLIDEKLGKQFAEAENIMCKGAVGVLIEAKSKGFIPLLKPLLDDLVNN
jgi:predicted nucleic acid-binding protein